MATFPPPILLDLPEPLYRALIAYQQQQGYSSPAIAIAGILSEFLQPQTPNLPTWATQEQVQKLEAQFNQLSQLVHLLQNQAIAASPKTEDSPSPPKNTNVTRSKSFSSSLVTTEENDDEPDEILYDFLE
jgi:hypothetical protein